MRTNSFMYQAQRILVPIVQTYNAWKTLFKFSTAHEKHYNINHMTGMYSKNGTRSCPLPRDAKPSLTYAQVAAGDEVEVNVNKDGEHNEGHLPL